MALLMVEAIEASFQYERRSSTCRVQWTFIIVWNEATVN